MKTSQDFKGDCGDYVQEARGGYQKGVCTNQDVPHGLAEASSTIMILRMTRVKIGEFLISRVRIWYSLMEIFNK